MQGNIMNNSTVICTITNNNLSLMFILQHILTLNCCFKNKTQQK